MSLFANKPKSTQRTHLDIIVNFVATSFFKLKLFNRKIPFKIEFRDSEQKHETKKNIGMNKKALVIKIALKSHKMKNEGAHRNKNIFPQRHT